MTLEDRILLFSKLGDLLLSDNFSEELETWSRKAKNENGWFTEDNVNLAAKNIGKEYLNQGKLTEFTKHLKFGNSKVVGIVAAGNIPFVCFHDLLCVVLSGHKAYLKLSANDTVLMKLLIGKLEMLGPEINEYIEIVERLNDADAIIATGSDNSSRYFEYYFAKKPHIIRGNRSSIGVLSGQESKSELRNFGNDIFQFFGLGCRNVSKVYVPKGYIFDTFFESIEYWNTIHIHHKYSNNYDYNKSIYLINGDHHYDNGFLLVKQDENLVSPLSVLFYEEYEDQLDLEKRINKHSGKIQCIVGSSYIPFGHSQTPRLADFADDINTLEFLSSL